MLDIVFLYKPGKTFLIMNGALFQVTSIFGK